MKNLALIGFLAMLAVVSSLLACAPTHSGDDDAAADDDSTPAGDDDDNDNDDASPGADDDDDDNDVSANVNVPANDKNWTPTGLQGAVGDRLTVNATGLVNLGSDGANVPPGGLPKICGAGCPNPAGRLGALTAKIGAAKSACIFEVGAHFDGAAACAGALYLIVNDYNYADNSGSFNAAIVMGGPADDDDNDNDDNDDDDNDDDDNDDDDNNDDDNDDDDNDNDDSSPAADDDDDDDTADDDVWTMMRDESEQVTLVSVWGSSPSDVFAVGPGPYDIETGIVHYNGDTWSQMSLFVDAYQLSGVWGSSSSDVFAVGNGYAITPNGGYSTGPAVFHYDGASWSFPSMPISGPLPGLSGVWGASPSDVFAVGGNYDASGAPIYHYDGVSWSRMPNDFQTSLSAVWGASHTDVIAAGGLILHYDGATWSEMTNPNNYIASAVWGSSPSDVYGINGSGISTVIIHYDGASWSQMQGRIFWPSGGLMGVWGSSATDVFAVGGGGVIEHYAGPPK